MLRKIHRRPQKALRSVEQLRVELARYCCNSTSVTLALVLLDGEHTDQHSEHVDLVADISHVFSKSTAREEDTIPRHIWEWY
jgi:hypothetical protein